MTRPAPARSSVVGGGVSLVFLVLVGGLLLPACAGTTTTPSPPGPGSTGPARASATVPAGSVPAGPVPGGSVPGGSVPAAADTSAADPGPVEERDVAVGPLTFHARLQGPASGEPVVLLHGFPQSSYEWRHQQRALAAAGYRTVAFDQRGYSPGSRPPAATDYRMDLLIGDVLGVADALGIATFHLVGHDWGAAVAWVVAATHPERLRSLTAVSVPHPAAYAAALTDPGSEQSRKSAYIETFAAPGAGARFGAADSTFLDVVFAKVLPPADIARYRAVLGSPDAMQAALNWYVANNPRRAPGPAVSAVRVRTLYVYSTGDCCLGRDAADATGAFVAAPYRYEVLDGVSHWVPEEAPERLDALLLAHLRSR